MLQKVEFGRIRQNLHLRGVFIEQAQALKVLSIKAVINILFQVAAHDRRRELQTGRPLLHNLWNVLETGIARLLKNLRQVDFRAEAVKCRLAYRPEGEDERDVQSSAAIARPDRKRNSLRFAPAKPGRR